MGKKILIIILLTVFTIGANYSQNFNKPKLDSLFDILAQKNKAIPILTVGARFGISSLINEINAL